MANFDEYRLALALQAAQLGTWTWDMATGVTVWDERLEELHGLPPGGFGGTFEDWVAAPERAITSQSAWAWFHIVDAVGTPRVDAPPDSLFSSLRFKTSHHSANATIEAQNPLRNPFARSDWDWRTFRCEP